MCARFSHSFPCLLCDVLSVRLFYKYIFVLLVACIVCVNVRVNQCDSKIRFEMHGTIVFKSL